MIGRGGMGVVMKAMHIHLKQPVAIKLLLPKAARNADVVQRFLREAQLVARLKSEHVARVTDVRTLDDGTPFIVLEYLDGMDLSRFSRSQLTVGGTIDLVLQACEALAEAHSLGIVHRDIKPANLFVTERADHTRLLKVLDFGTSKSALGVSLTAVRAVLGTPLYMSPEQIRSSCSVDLRSDIWSLGVVLYQLLRGARPFDGHSLRAVALRILNEPLPKVTVALPGALDQIIHRCLEKDPARRFQNVAELAHAIASYAESKTEAAISAERTRRTLGNVTLALAPTWQPERAIAPPALRATEAPKPDVEPPAAPDSSVDAPAAPDSSVDAPAAPDSSVDAPAAPEPGGVRWSLLVALAALACAIGATAAVVARSLERTEGAGPAPADRPSAEAPAPAPAPAPVPAPAPAPAPPTIAIPALTIAEPGIPDTERAEPRPPVAGPAAPGIVAPRETASRAPVARRRELPVAVTPSNTVAKQAKRRTHAAGAMVKPRANRAPPKLSREDIIFGSRQ